MKDKRDRHKIVHLEARSLDHVSRARHPASVHPHCVCMHCKLQGHCRKDSGGDNTAATPGFVPIVWIGKLHRGIVSDLHASHQQAGKLEAGVVERSTTPPVITEVTRTAEIVSDWNECPLVSMQYYCRDEDELVWTADDLSNGESLDGAGKGDAEQVV
ncbi:unnamed protein product [Trichogramma brassicae]|uniref:Uncharacterized protein n=1 Tax=Trichogramma brassicae TaxID=86971 RepID=A0A6H5IYB8_9HYME|nr:unnamed protein product [Trichogramma brassicae]